MGSKFSKTKRKDSAPPLSLTERDVVVVKALYRFTILTGDQLYKLAGGGKDGFRKRLRRLYDAGYVTRPAIQNELFRYGDTRPTVYTLGQGGADYLREFLGYRISRSIDWERNARERKGLVGQRHVLHDLGANGAVIALQSALEALEGVSVLSPEEIVAQSPEWTQKAKNPFSLPSSFIWDDGRQYERNVIPDGVLAYIDTRHEEPIKAMLFVEYDQEMDIKRSDPRQSSIKQKVASYSSIFKDKRIKERFGFDHFRVLFITTGSAKRVEKMVEGCASYRSSQVRGAPPYVFFFSTSADFEAADNPLVKVWCDGDGESKNITSLSL